MAIFLEQRYKFINWREIKSISEETITQWEETYDVDIRYSPETGRFTVQSIYEPPENLISSVTQPWDKSATTYQVSGNILQDDIRPDANFAEALGVDLTGNDVADFTAMQAASFREGGGQSKLDAFDPDFAESSLHNVAVVAGALRTDGQIPPEAWAANPSIGGAGAGSDILDGGGQGGQLSEVGIPHDADHFIGSNGYGPMAELADVVALTGKTPAGLHGLGGFVELGTLIKDPEANGQLQAEQGLVPATQQFPDYVLPEVYGYPAQADGWNIIRNPYGQISEDEREFGSEGPEMLFESQQVSSLQETLTEYKDFVEAGGDPEVANAALRMTEDRYSEEAAELVHDQDVVASVPEPVNEESYGLV